MNLKSKIPQNTSVLLRILIYFAFGCAGVILTRTINSLFLSFFLTVIVVCLFALLFSHTGYFAIIFCILPTVFIALTDSYSAALLLFPHMILAAVIGLSIKHRVRPSNTILIATSAYLLSMLLFGSAEIVLTSGISYLIGFLKNLPSEIDNFFVLLTDILNTIPEVDIKSTDIIVSNAKALLVGSILSAFVVSVCITYFSTVVLARIARDKKVYSGKSMVDIKPSIISVWVYIICVLISVFFVSANDKIYFYTHLSTNLVTVLTPIFVFTGIYYLANIKFKVEHANPGFTIFILVVSLLLAQLQIIVYYLSYCGITYALKTYYADKLSMGTVDKNK
ncbi:MAG: DUF2232 domain-containing protein [Ruminococcaceae bacterium]|nr:DUF2232 domain-containing protein [Oscillospiraceae bacterium]